MSDLSTRWWTVPLAIVLGAFIGAATVLILFQLDSNRAFERGLKACQNVDS